MIAQALDTPFTPLPDSLDNLLRSFMTTEPSAATATRQPASEDLLATGFRFGEIVGRGGMGTVYRA